jgi:hypothetical protein
MAMTLVGAGETGSCDAIRVILRMSALRRLIKFPSVPWNRTDVPRVTGIPMETTLPEGASSIR